MTDDNQLYNLSRRKMLAGLGAVGLASAGVGLGTNAYFSDREAFTGNTLTAGTLDMSVTADVVAANEYWVNQGGLDLSATADSEEAVVGLVVEDVKPGDWGIVCFDVDVGDNPGYLRVSTAEFAETGGASTEPELAVDPDNLGDLGESLLTTVWQSYAGPTEGPGGMRSDLSVLDPLFNLASDDLDISYGTPDVGGVVDERTHYTTAREANDVLAGGYLVKDNTGAPMVVGSGEESYRFCLLLEIPPAVGNVIQGDTLAFDLVFETEQVRNNETPFQNE